MSSTLTKNEDNLSRKLKWLMLSRLLFALLLMGGTLIYSANENLSYFAKPLIYFYWLTAWIIFLSLFYALVFYYFENESVFAYLQTVVDTLIATAIIFLTGSFSSLFSFLYLIVIIYASMLHSRKGSLIIAGLCSLQYGAMIDLEYYGIINPLLRPEGFVTDNYDGSQLIYKMCTVMAACFVTAVLSSYLAEQERRAQNELIGMEDHVKRVERMAVVGEMAAGLAHEIKNPLASLSGSIQLLEESEQGDLDQQKLMRIALREAERLSSLVSEFLLFAKPKAGNITAIQVDVLLEEMISLFENDDKLHGGINLIKKIDKELWTEMDPGHFRQVILNLLLNAVDAIGSNRGTISIKSYALKNGFIRIKITDDGKGMDEATSRLIFDPFFTTKAKGTGLGLSIVLRILEEYGCRIDVRSEPDYGTEFLIKLKEIACPY